MNELLPIIRRKRRPLLPVEVVSVQPPAAVKETHKTEATAGTQETEAGEASGVVSAGGKPKPTDDEAA